MRYVSGDVILYNPSGVCRIEDVREETFAGTAGEYYVLKPICQEGSTIYIPIENERLTQRMRPLLSPEEAEALLRKTPTRPDWIEDSRERSETYMHLLSQGDRSAMIRIIRLLSDHKAEVTRQNHKFYASDEKVLAAARRMIGEELAYVLHTTPEEALNRLPA
ncbi:MAG: hypothetical protein IKI63_03560 [Clostridia bacterium]|nr:hypothetical protein [Clostridia bacterium]